ncbi:hypothetical protein pb186bvf_011777 [Paramecium bursaria]
MKKGAKSNGHRQGHQRPYPHGGQMEAHAGPWFYVPGGGAPRRNPYFPGMKGQDSERQGHDICSGI